MLVTYHREDHSNSKLGCKAKLSLNFHECSIQIVCLSQLAQWKCRNTLLFLWWNIWCTQCLVFRTVLSLEREEVASSKKSHPVWHNAYILRNNAFHLTLPSRHVLNKWQLWLLALSDSLSPYLSPVLERLSDYFGENIIRCLPKPENISTKIAEKENYFYYWINTKPECDVHHRQILKVCKERKNPHPFINTQLSRYNLLHFLNMKSN